jgi:uncharacterized Zn finger protein
MNRMSHSRTEPTPSGTGLSDCPLCGTHLVVNRIVPGPAGLEHWTLRCTRCGHIHQDAVSTSSAD